jgi:bifunctional DNA-binding transcriptional regulator/antitoxin component of YhaV-PrlF toxin-antitoxin module
MSNQVKAKDSGPGESTVKATRKGRGNSSRLSSKNQVTIPVDVMREVGFKVGDELVFNVEDGVVVIQPITDAQKILSLAGFLGGIYNDYDHQTERADAWED